jgi:hypothetical protein
MNTVVEFAENLLFDELSMTTIGRDKDSQKKTMNKEKPQFSESRVLIGCTSRTSLRKGVIRALLSGPPNWTLQLLNGNHDESDADLYPCRKHTSFSSRRSRKTGDDDNNHLPSLERSNFNSQNSSSTTNSVQQRVVTFHPILEVREYSLAIKATCPPDPPLLLTLDWSYRCQLGALDDSSGRSGWNYESFPRHLDYLERRARLKAVTGPQDSEINTMLQEAGYSFVLSPMRDSGTLLSALQKTYQSMVKSHTKERLDKEFMTQRNRTSLKIT